MQRPPKRTPRIRGSEDKKAPIAVMDPTKIAMPPNLGIGLLCIRLESLGISTAPIFGASQIATGVKIKLSTRAVAKINI